MTVEEAKKYVLECAGGFGGATASRIMEAVNIVLEDHDRLHVAIESIRMANTFIDDVRCHNCQTEMGETAMGVKVCLGCGYAVHPGQEFSSLFPMD